MDPLVRHWPPDPGAATARPPRTADDRLISILAAVVAGRAGGGGARAAAPAAGSRPQCATRYTMTSATTSRRACGDAALSSFPSFLPLPVLLRPARCQCFVVL